MKLNHLLTPLVSDMRAILAHHNADLAAMDHGKTGLKAMYALLDVVSKNRAYNDEHPGFTSGTWKRVLPFDGREYCFYYADGANDTHVATLLKAAKAALLSNR